MASGWSDCCLERREVNALYSSIALRVAVLRGSDSADHLFQARLFDPRRRDEPARSMVWAFTSRSGVLECAMFT
jgi:hypothetical protein